MKLADVVATSVDQRAPAGRLAIQYAELIDECGHVRTALADALDTLRTAALLADETSTDDAHERAYRKVAAALSAVTVASDLGPKLLAALDALLATPKAQAAAKDALGGITPAKPLSRLRANHANRHLRAVG